MATTAEMLNDPAYIRQIKAIADQTAWNNMLKTSAELANQNPWTGLGQLLGTAIGLKWGRNEGEADYQRSMDAFQNKKYQDALNIPIVGMASQEAFDMMNNALPKHLQAPIERVAQQNLLSQRNQVNNPAQLPQPQTPINSQPMNPLWFNQNEVQKNFSKSVNYSPPPKYDFNLNFSNYKYNPQNNGVNTWQNKMFEKYPLLGR